MNQEWLEEFQRLYAELIHHMNVGAAEMTARLMEGHLPLDIGILGALGQATADAQAVSLETCYRVLGLPRSASLDEVDHRYRTLAKRLHPDVAGPETAHLFQMVHEAYQRIRKGQ